MNAKPLSVLYIKFYTLTFHQTFHPIILFSLKQKLDKHWRAGYVLIWTLKQKKREASAANVNLELIGQVHWGAIWKSILEKNQTNAPSVAMNQFVQVISTDIWKRT